MFNNEPIETPLEHEAGFIDILNSTLEEYTHHNQTSNDIVHLITSYIFSNEYYFRRDCHRIDITRRTITLYLYRSKLCVNLFKLTIPICGEEFIRYIDSISSVASTPNNDPRIIDSIDSPKSISAWIDTECKDDSFSDSKAANLVHNACFLMMTYFEDTRQNITPWLVQWKYDENACIPNRPFLQVMARIISYPSDWNYVTISYKYNVSVVFYTSMEQHTIRFIPHTANTYKEEVSVVKFGSGLNYPWLMFGSAGTKILSYQDILLLFGNESSPLLADASTMDQHCEYFVTRSCKDFIEMKDHGAFWTTSRDHISIFQITDKRDYAQKVVIEEQKEDDRVDLNVQCQLLIFNNTDTANMNYSNNILDVTVSNDWSGIFQRKYGIERNHKLFMLLYTEIQYDANTTELYAAYINVRGGTVERLYHVKLASSNCLTKFLVGRGCYQTVHNDWVCTLIGVDESNHEVRHQLRLTEQLQLLYHQKVKRNENVQEVTHRYRCKALKWFKRAKKEELAMQKANQPPSTFQVVWDQVVSSRHLIFSTLVGAYVGWRLTRMVRNGRWTFRFGF